MDKLERDIKELNQRIALVLMESKVAEEKVRGIEEVSLQMEDLVKRLPELDKLSETTSVCSERLEKLEGRLQQQKPVTAAELNEVKAELEKTQEIDLLKNELDLLNQTISSIAEELEESKGNISSVSAKIEKTENTVKEQLEQNLEKHLSEAQEKIAKTETLCSELSEKLSEETKKNEEKIESVTKDFNEKITKSLQDGIKSELEKFKEIIDSIEKSPKKIEEMTGKIQEISDMYDKTVTTLTSDLELAQSTEKRLNAASRLLEDIEKKAERLFAPLDVAINDIESFENPNPDKELGFELNDLLQVMIKHQASDLHLKEGAPPTVRLEGDLVPVGGETLSDVNCKYLVLSGMNRNLRRQLLEKKEIDFAYSIPEARFRVNAFMQKGSVSASYRMLKTEIPSIESLRLPTVIKKLVSINNGLVLVTGPAGSGKSTTLASLVDYLNANKKLHIVTVEDPIEYIHSDKISLVTQREVGSDTPSFLDALKASLRQDPNVILIGEMRDAETIFTSTIAAETGHLVLSTLHTPNTVQAIQRIIDVFPGEQQQQYRLLLSSTLRGVISQRLLNRQNGEGRVPAVEIMIVTPTISSLISDNKLSEIYPLMVEGKGEGMQTFTQALTELVESGIISKEDALYHAEQRTEFRLGVEGHTTGSSASIQDDSLMSWL